MRTSVTVRPAQSLRRRARALLSWLHLWVGLTVGTLFAVISLSGTVLVFHADLLRWQHPQLASHVPSADGRVLADVLTTWTPQGLAAIDLPRASLPVWQGYFKDGTRRYFAPEDGALLLSRTEHDDALLWLHELHTVLLGGERGETVVSAVGWIALGLLFTGVYLWWPARGRIVASLRMHANPPVRRWLTWHRSAGAISVPLVLLLTLTGVGMVHHDGARALLTGIFGGTEPPKAPALPSAKAVEVPMAAAEWPAILASAQAALPGARLSRLAVPGDDSAAIAFRSQARGEWHPNGRSLVFIDPGSARPLLRHDATAQPLGARLDEAIYPLHIGAVGGGVMRWATAVAGVLPTFLLVTGALFWWRRRSGKRAAAAAQSGPAQPKPAARPV